MIHDPKRFVALDTETFFIEKGILAPPLVCGSVAQVRDGGIAGELLDRSRTLSLARSLLSGDAVIVGANIAYDFGVLAKAQPSLLPLIFKAYEEDRIYDVQIAQALNAIYDGNLYQDPRTGEQLRNPDTNRPARYSLQICVDLMLGRPDAKKHDAWKGSYALLADVPISEWPEDARVYPVDDAVNTLEVALAQVNGGGAGCIQGPLHNLEDVSNQVAAAFALHLGAVWGLRTDPARVEALRKRADDAHAKFLDRFKDLGFFREDGSANQAVIKRAVVKAYGNGGKCTSPGCVGGKVLSPKSGNPINCKACSGTGLDVTGVPTAAKGGVTINRDALTESGDDDLVALGESEFEKVRTTYVPFLLEGTDRPITLRPNVLVASGRTSYDGPIQLLPRGVVPGDIAGAVRPCFKARPGYVYCSVDFAALELCTLSQVCLWLLGRSYMADTINATGKPGSLHTAFAARLAGTSAEDMALLIAKKDPAAKKYRQAAKAGNFGFPGGMGAAKFVVSKRKRNEGSTTAPDGKVYEGIRFCILLGGAERCGVEKVTMWPEDPVRARPTPPVCKKCVQEAELLRKAWFQQWPEIGPTWKPGTYFEWVNSRVETGAPMPCLGTFRERGGCGFTDAANNAFQALASDGAKRALWRLTTECYTKRDSVLWGTRPVVFAHDEVVAEIPEEMAYLAAPKMAEIMIGGMKELVPDVAIEAEPCLMRYWYKDAEAVYLDDKLVPWEPKAILH